jgi:type I restriction enzyme S subunit
MSRYKRYERYKDSGVEWIGEIPEHWNNKKISWIFNIIGSGTTPSTSNLEYYDGDVPWVNTGDLNDGYLYETSKMITDLALKDYSTLKFYPIDTLLIAMYGATIGKLSITKIIATTNQACCALAQPKNVNIKFIFYWFLANRNHIIAMAYGGGQPNISQNLIKSLRINLPEKHEQNAIVNFLDQKTAEIDDLIADKEKLIELLQEKRQAIITEAVIKGLNPNVKMKDSGIEWIGEIPEHWDVIKLKYVTKLVYGDSLPTENREEGEVDVFGSNGKVGTHNVANTLSPVIIVGRKGSYGKVTYSDKKCFAIDTTYYIDNRCTKSNIKWLYYSLMVLELDKNSQDTGVPGLSREYAYNKYVPVPTVNEQVAIANFLDQKTAEIDSLVTETKNQIEKLKEYRQSLISEAVTGKIDVREFQKKNEVIFRNE